MDDGKVKLVKKRKDIPNYNQSSKFTPGAILALEGAIPLAKNENGTILTDLDEIASRVDSLHDIGVRIITLMHFWSNELGGVMTDAQIDPASPTDGHLTPTGQLIVERMMKKMMIVDAAHAHKNTLEDIATLAITIRFPSLILTQASFTSGLRGRGGGPWTRWKQSLRRGASSARGRSRPATARKCSRVTFADWVNETVEIASAIGIEHVGLGTDPGGVGISGN